MIITILSIRNINHFFAFPLLTLSAYNLYFQQERPKLIEANGKLSFEDLGKLVGKRWRNLAPGEREKYEKEALQDSLRYRAEMETYNQEKKKRIANMDKIDDDDDDDDDNDDEDDKPPLREVDAPISSEADRNASTSPLPLPPLAAGRAVFSRPRSSSADPYPQNMPPAPNHPYPYYHPGDQNNPHAYYPAPPFRSVPPPPSLDPSMFPIPPGMELMLPDRDGRDRKYRVHYACYTMPREAAEQYMQRMSAGGGQHNSRTSSSDSRPPPPAAYSPHSYPGHPPPPPHQNPSPPGGPPPPPRYDFRCCCLLSCLVLLFSF